MTSRLSRPSSLWRICSVIIHDVIDARSCRGHTLADEQCKFSFAVNLSVVLSLIVLVRDECRLLQHRTLPSTRRSHVRRYVHHPRGRKHGESGQRSFAVVNACLAVTRLHPATRALTASTFMLGPRWVINDKMAEPKLVGIGNCQPKIKCRITPKR